MLPTCPKCDNQSFSLVEGKIQTPRGGFLPVPLIVCSSCGAAVGVYEHHNISKILDKAEAIARKVRTHEM